MDVLYNSTRSEGKPVTASTAILKGLSEDGGLFVPDHIPALEKSLKELSEMTYQETAYEVMKLFFTDFTREELRDCIQKAYDSKFDTEKIAPMRYACGVHYLELFHGATIAFKDMALSILPHLLITSAKKNKAENEIIILTATSGDTGKAALSGFADVEGTRIIVFYPEDGVSPIQKKQMITQKGDNTLVVGIRGNFDDAQTGVKELFSNKELAKEMEAKGFQFSSANSINIGRLIPQIVYYVYAYASLLKEGKIKEGEKINFVVPTGNFGNILAAFYAKDMGLPIGKLICASNENKVLYDFMLTGVYDRNREFMLTSSPSMDILISSNLERLIYRIAGNDVRINAQFMEDLISQGKYTITEEMKARLNDFYGNYADEQETAAAIRKTYEACGYVLDPHTAVAAAVYDKYVQDKYVQDKYVQDKYVQDKYVQDKYDQDKYVQDKYIQDKHVHDKHVQDKHVQDKAESDKYLSDSDDTAQTVIVSTASPFKFTNSVMNAICPEHEEKSDFELVEELAGLSQTAIPGAIEEIRTAPVLHTKICNIDEMEQVVKQFLGM